MIKNYLTYINESENYIGRKVKILDTSNYKNQAYDRNGDGFGVIIDYDERKRLPYTILWNSKHINSYQIERDFVLVDEEEDNDTVSIKWYKKGKFEKE